MRVRSVYFSLSLSFSLWSLGALFSTVLGGCGSSSAPPLGGLGQACYEDNRCNSELACVASVCVRSGPGGTAAANGGADAGGAAGKDGAAGTSGAGGAAGND